MRAFPEASVLATVPLKFAGTDLRFKTSHALFSGKHIDTGTMLLLKTLVQQKVVPEHGRVLDAGCGYGPLAVALKRHRPALEVVARDRLALAAAYTQENARLNQVEVSASPGLLLEGTPGPWTLIVSNLPAKAGDRVLCDFVTRSLSLIAPDGVVAVVIVETLAQRFSQWLDEASVRRIYEESGPGYRVFHYGTSAPSTVTPAQAFPSAYLRGQVSFFVGTQSFVQSTYFGLPNFDALDYRLQMTLPLLVDLKPRGDVMVWEPVQGHLARWGDSAMGADSVLHLAGNDQLALLAAQQNVGQRTVELHAVPFLGDVDLGSGSLGAALVQFHPEPEIPWVDDARESLLRLLAPGGTVVVNGSSTDLTRFLERHKGFRILRDERSKGWRAALLERQKLS